MQTTNFSMDHLLDSHSQLEDYIRMGRNQDLEGSIAQFDFEALDVDLGQSAKTTCKLLSLQPRQDAC
jgi:hypothetical protein